MKVFQLFCGASFVAASLATPALAQSISSDPAAPAQTGLDEIVVTAQKRAENLQRVPIAVTAASGEALAAQGITSALQLNTVAPGLNIRTTAGAFQPSIRGIGTSSNVVENPVALYIDGVYYPNQRDGLRELNDIAQIAVLKGPQGTLFGRNATGGVIQITTLAPTQELTGNAKVEMDNYRTLKSSVFVSGGLADTVAASLGVSYIHQGEGYGRNLTNGHDTYRIKHDFSIRGKILFTPGDNTSITVIGDYMDRFQFGNSYQPYNGLPLSVPGTGPLTSVYDTYGGCSSSEHSAQLAA